MKVEGRAYCTCGGMLAFRVRGSDARAIADRIAAGFWAEHLGQGHGRTNAQQAAAARRQEST